MKLVPRCIVVTLVMVTWVVLHVHAQHSAYQTITFEVKPITKIHVSANPQPLVIDRNVSGDGDVTILDNATRYSILTNQNDMKIVASIDHPMPDGTRLLLAAASSAGISRGTVDLSGATAPVEMVSSIQRGIDRDQSLSYMLVADASIQKLDRQSRLVTLTITN